MSFHISREVKLVSWSTAILWFGWGFGESLIPVFLYQFAHGYAASGLLKAVYDATAIIVTPLIGYFVDRLSLKKLMLLGISLYLLVSLNYYFAGAFMLVILLIIARFLNGFSYPLTAIVRENYIYCYTVKNKVVRAFGYFDTVSILAWVSAVVLSLFLVPRFAVYQLLFLVAPAAVLSFGLALFLPSDRPAKKLAKPHWNFKPYREIIKEALAWPLKLKIVIFSSLLVSLVTSAFFFFIPIEVWRVSSDLKQIIILAIFNSLPQAAGNLLGWMVDKININRAVAFSFIGVIGVLIASIFFTSFLWRLSALILVGIFDETILLSRRQLIADFNVKHNFWLVKSRHNFGAINSVLEEITNFGDLAGVLAIGLVIDLINWPAALIFMALIMATVLTIFRQKKIIDWQSLIV